jgi:hypothetical protein
MAISLSPWDLPITVGVGPCILGLMRRERPYYMSLLLLQKGVRLCDQVSESQPRPSTGREACNPISAT